MAVIANTILMCPTARAQILLILFLLVVEVTCSDGGTPPSTTTISTRVNTVSMNDHAPDFGINQAFLPVPEDTPVGEDIMCYVATDADRTDTPDSIVQYSLTLTNALGTDRRSRFGVRENNGCIFVSLALDYNLTSFYSYSVFATDMGEQPRTGRLRLFISVLDPPTFINTPYNQNIFETAESGTLVARIECTDTDNNNAVTYKITSGNEDGLFIIDDITGNVLINRTLDYEASTAHTLTVVCTDRYDLNDTTEVFVNVVPINEHTPSFSSRLLEIAEHSSIGVTITELDWVDLDSGQDGEVVFRILSGNIGNAFQVNPDGQVIVRGSLDREVLDFYSLEIMITDQSPEVENRRSSTNGINITITDINNNTPLFDSDPYLFGPLNGNEVVGDFVGTVSCSDADIGSNADVDYELVNNSTLLFGIDVMFDVDMISGDVTVAGDLSTREFDNITFFIQCTDLGVPPRASIARVAVVVEEINTNAPEFTNASYYVEVAEDIPIIEHTIITVSADDRDAGINGQVSYRLQDDHDNRFFIDDESGELSLLRSLDFETEVEYIVIVEAIDGAVDSPMRLTSSAEVRITITGVNEFTPICNDPVYVVIVNKTTQGDIIDFGCSDDDSGNDGSLVYNFTNGNEESFFAVSSDGQLIVPTPIVPDTRNEQFSLQISVSDEGEPARVITIEAIVIYSFDNLDAPTFNESSYSLMVSELVEVGQIVTTILAEDTDPGLQGEIVYRIEGTDSFRVDSVSGDLFVARPLDWESDPIVTFNIVAADSDPFQPRSSLANVTVNVQDVDDNPPGFAEPLYFAVLNSTTDSGTPVINVECMDADMGSNALISYALDNTSADARFFSIDEETGLIQVAMSLSVSRGYLITVLCVGPPPQSHMDTAVVSIEVAVKGITATTQNAVTVVSMTTIEDKTESTGSSDILIGILIGIVAGVIVGLVIAVAFVLIIIFALNWRKSKQQTTNNPTTLTAHGDENVVINEAYSNTMQRNVAYGHHERPNAELTSTTGTEEHIYEVMELQTYDYPYYMHPNPSDVPTAAAGSPISADN